MLTRSEGPVVGVGAGFFAILRPRDLRSNRYPWRYPDEEKYFSKIQKVPDFAGALGEKPTREIKPIL
jgi:hypothetical protein